MGEQPMTKMFKFVIAALTVAMLAAKLMAGTPAGAAHDPNISGELGSQSLGRYFYVAATVTESQVTFSTDGGLTWTATAQQYFAGEYDLAQDNRDGPRAGTFRRRTLVADEFSSDGGSTWTATGTQYLAGEHDSAQDNGDGPAAGTFRRRINIYGSYSSDGGSTWTNRSLTSKWITGEYDPAQDNGDGPAAGTFRWRSMVPEYSIDGGSTWTATMQQYNAGETDPVQDNGDGPGAGMFRSQDVSLIVYLCYYQSDRTAGQIGPDGHRGWLEHGTLNNPIIRPCPGPRREVSREGSNTYTWNVDDGIEPPGDWCVSGGTPADISMICRGEGYTYREARRELGYGLGRP